MEVGKLARELKEIRACFVERGPCMDGTCRAAVEGFSFVDVHRKYSREQVWRGLVAKSDNTLIMLL